MPFKGFTLNGKNETVEEALSHPEKYGLPRGLLKALAIIQRKEKRGDVSVTQLVDPPRVTILKERHDYYEEPESMLWAVFGKALHLVVAAGASSDSLPEFDLASVIHEVKVTGQSDLYEKDGTVLDYKTTSVYAFRDSPQGKLEWIKQLNLYAELYRRMEYEVKRLRLCALLKDWRSWEARRDKKGWYPKSPILMIEVPLWSEAQAGNYITDRVDLWNRCKDLDEKDLPACTPEENWDGKRCDKWCSIAKHCSVKQKPKKSK